MHTLLLDGTQPENSFHRRINELITADLDAAGWPYKAMGLSEMNIGNCIGCGNCSFRSPGVCTRDDDMSLVFEAYVNSGLVIFLTPVLFGCYHWQLKKAVDRFIPLLVPRYTIRNGELHHKLRYKKRPLLAGIGILKDFDEGQKRTFIDLVQRNAVNIGAPEEYHLVLSETSGEEYAAERLKGFFTGLQEKHQ